MTGRKCGNCKHFDPGPLWRKGWCRNPLLYAPHQSHLVNDEDLDCERGMGNYWEAADGATVESDIASGFQEPVAQVFQSRESRPPMVSDSGQPVYPVMGAAGQGGDNSPYGDPPGGGWSGGDPPNSSGRDYNYYPEERYWTDYLRIAAPILGVILMVLLFWWWISNFLGDDDENGQIAGENETPVVLPTVLETEEPQNETPPVDGTPPPIVIGGETPPAGDETTPPDGEQPPPDGEAPPEQAELFEGATVEVFNTGGTGVNVRSQPSTDSEIITVFLDGTILTIIGVAIEAEGFVWWPVSGDGVEGYVVQEYLALSE